MILFHFISIVLTLACAQIHICLCCANVLYSAASLKVKLQCSHVENNPIRVWESVILCNPSTAMKNRDLSGSESAQTDTAALTNILSFIKEFMIIQYYLSCESVMNYEFNWSSTFYKSNNLALNAL